ncbi:MAG: tRNA (adenosine(37)-N6)-threonylcarbamoyltransferase complex dimerization subunit type 1 TsaB [Bacteroidales bacterium]|nr:tRNA (adenosine(37)-N6)-threonylcarbamoyltransferase complex dimerization subunit type 1 TsaB [Bacteroidales bacterium]
MPLILCIETATTACSVALIKNGALIEIRHSDKKNAHSTILNILINELLAFSGFQFSDLNAVAVSKGPGSYTGLRIGVSTAKGLCYALDIPVIAPDTLLCMASGFVNEHPGLPENALLCPMIDARRMEVFAAIYDLKLEAISPVDAIFVNDEAFPGLTGNRPVYYFGDGAEKCLDTLNHRSDWNFVPGFINSASHMASLAANYFKSAKFEDVAYFEPFYLKDFVAGKPVVKGLR